MLLNWIREQAKLILMPDDIDLSEVHVGYEFALRPEIIGFLAGQMTTKQAARTNEKVDKMQLVLDEHELAIG